MKSEKVVVVGLGYIGFPTALVLANSGFEVLGVDINMNVISSIQSGKVHIAEPGLHVLLQKMLGEHKLTVSNVMGEGDIYVIAVPTPLNEKQDPDLSMVFNAVEDIAPYLKPGDLVIIESTCPVGTSDAARNLVKKNRPDLCVPHEGSSTADINIAYCPERVLPGQILKELLANARIIGGISNNCAERALEFYSAFVNGECCVTNARTAEMVKLTENAYRDVSIAFANELSILSEDLNVNVWEVIDFANLHPRVNILQPGPGVGGHCIAIDPFFLIHSSPTNANLIRQARRVNTDKINFSTQKIKDKVSLFKQNKQNALPRLCIAYFGLTFKPNIDDLRESPSLEIVNQMSSDEEAEHLVVEPNLYTLPSIIAENCEMVSIEQALQKADIFVFLVKHDQFNDLEISGILKDKIIDLCGITRR